MSIYKTKLQQCKAKAHLNVTLGIIAQEKRAGGSTRYHTAQDIGHRPAYAGTSMEQRDVWMKEADS